MSTITERAELPACERSYGFSGTEWLCHQPAVGRYRRACVHEHIRDGQLCQGCSEALAAGGICLACIELDGDLAHECPIILRALGPEVAA